ncbi:YaaR family protein [Clostridiisalibacter paucivorans]|uniref:YaaR family protein n=1 Tax=Clostridiisalibacter paucivorans TaxID=408753 RepID=UPI000479078C|nr:YaaR family protein [Clostridiisalibacter paucivorans]
MKINDILNNTSKGIDVKSTEKAINTRVNNKTFMDKLDSMKGMSAKERLNTLLDRIDKQAARISKNVDIKEVVVYKKLISEFMKESVDNMVKFSKNNFLDRRGRHRVYGIIKKVNTELEELTKDVLQKEKDNIKILKRLDDIRGLILDIYM